MTLERVHDLIMVPCIQLFIEAEFNGVKVDLDKMDDAEVYLREELEKAENNLRSGEESSTR
jgi:DNA polymerase I-like protein with 3'-5' exonuclease and polymerase domains